MPEFAISPVIASPEAIAALSGIITDVVEDGGSVSFMHPLSRDDAQSFWQAALAAADRGEQIILGACHGRILAGTVTLLLDMPPNQPHRAEIAKLMVRPAYRKQGLATKLLQAAETHAFRLGRTLVVLDTATDGGARALYEKQGYTLTGEIPDYALKPHGGLTGTLIYWKRLVKDAQSEAARY